MHVIFSSSIVLLTGWGLLSFLRWARRDAVWTVGEIFRTASSSRRR
jgi:hypothetical protein